MRSIVEATWSCGVLKFCLASTSYSHKSAVQELQEENEQLQRVAALPPKKQAGIVMEELEIRKT